MDYDRLVLAYKLSERFIEEGNDNVAKQFCDILFDFGASKVCSIFDKSSRFEYPVLDCLCEWLFKKNANFSLENVIETVNQCLKECDRLYYVITQDDLKHPFYKTEVESLPFPFEVEDRKRIYQYLTHKISALDVRYFAHFLIPYDDVDKIYADNVENIQGVITAVLDSWDCMSPSWNKLKSVLKFLGKDELVNNIKGGAHDYGQKIL